LLNDLWLLFSCILLFIGLVASQGLLLVVGSLVIIIWLASKLWERYAFRQVSHQRLLSRHRAFIGDTLEYTVSLSNDKILPLIWVDIHDGFPHELDLPGGGVRGTGMDVAREHRITTSLLPYQRVSWKYNLRCLARGYHRIGPARVRSGDIFGFTAAETQFAGVDHILVYPRIVDLRDLILPSEHPLGESRGRRPLHHDPSRFLGQRDYHPTDPMKHIDWKATARRSALQTRVFEPVMSLNVLIGLDATTTEFAWQGTNRRLFERAVTAAASVASHCAEQGYSFGLFSNAVAVYSGKWLRVPLGGADTQLDLTLESLAMVGPYAVTSLAEVLRSERDSLPPGTTIVVVTAIVTRTLAAELAELRWRGYRVVLAYAGDGGPGVDLPGITVHLMGRALQGLEDHESVLAG
jgi:uncharacterized protein (DUF58 family)